MPGTYRHPVQLFELPFPEEWSLLRSLEEGEVVYHLTPEKGLRDPRRMRTGISLLILAVGRESTLARRDAEGILRHLLPAVLRLEPGLRQVGPIEAAVLGSTRLRAARVRHEGSLAGREGEFVTESWVARDGGLVFFATLLAPRSAFDARAEALRGVLAGSRFGRPLPPRLDTSLEARRIVEDYQASVVMIETPDGTGSGFVISPAGYVLTNHHVVERKAGGTHETVVVRWDESLRRPSLRARVVDAVRLPSEVRSMLGLSGTDLALLKLPAGRYRPLPLTPTAAVRPGDGVVTLGFPGGRSFGGVSLTVTTGVVTRFNRGRGGRVGSILIDATTGR